MHRFWFNFLLLLFLIPVFAIGQERQKYWISFSDKSTSIENGIVENHNADIQQIDLPISTDYLNSLKEMDVEVHHASKWLNAVSATFDLTIVDSLKKMAFIKEITPVNTHISVLSCDYNDLESLTAVLDQINAQTLIDAGYNGRGVDIGIIDVGFFGAKINGSLKPLFKNKKVQGFKDFVDHNNDSPFGSLQPFSNAHGTTVWKLVGGLNASTNTQYGLATKANYFLARTDNTKSEFRVEEDYWIAAIEWMDSLGVKLVNTSLGYSLGFDDPKENYSPEDMDGKTAKISQAAQIAVEKKGMLLVVAAGNEGNDKDWQIVSAPADAQGVLSVGATGLKTTAKIRYSSIGPTFLPYLKPNVSCYSASGTSFSAPVVTGLAACIMQMDPTLTNQEIKTIIEKSGNLYPYGNNFVGYGIPNAAKIVSLVNDKTAIPNENKLVRTDDSSIVIPIDSKIEGRIALFHKSNETIVESQEEVIHQGNRLIVQKADNIKFTTVVLRDRVIEVVWE